MVEADRDRWQRPSDVLQALDLHEGNVAVDLGSGAGYFALRAAAVVGQRGEVFGGRYPQAICRADLQHISRVRGPSTDAPTFFWGASAGRAACHR